MKNLHMLILLPLAFLLIAAIPDVSFADTKSPDPASPGNGNSTTGHKTEVKPTLGPSHRTPVAEPAIKEAHAVKPTIEIVWPEDGEYIDDSRKYRSIRWKAPGLVGNVSVVVSYKGLPVHYTFYRGVPATTKRSDTYGKHTFRVPPEWYIPHFKYKIAVSSVLDPTIRDEVYVFFVPGRKLQQQGLRATLQTGQRQHPEGRKKTSGGSVKIAPAIKTAFKGKALTTPGKVNPKVKFAYGDAFSHYQVQRKNKHGKWSKARVYKTKVFTLSGPGKYRYRAVSKKGLESAWDTVVVVAKPAKKPRLHKSGQVE